MIVLQSGPKRMASNAGIAIGPILFIIAILGILAAAIAAGSGSFTIGTSSEGNRTKSAALIQIGENLKIGMDRIVMSGGLDPTAVNTDTADTSGVADLFSPIGGGIAPPSVGMANDPSSDKWYFPQGVVAGIGTGGSNNSVIAVLPVSQGVCAEINNRSVGVAIVPEAADLGDFTGNEVTGAAWPDGTGTPVWPTSATADPKLTGVATGCVNNNATMTTAVSSPYFFYQIMAIQ